LRQRRLDFEKEERNGVPKQELATAEQDLGKLQLWPNTRIITIKSATTKSSRAD